MREGVLQIQYNHIEENARLENFFMGLGSGSYISTKFARDFSFCL